MDPNSSPHTASHASEARREVPVQSEALVARATRFAVRLAQSRLRTMERGTDQEASALVSRQGAGQGSSQAQERSSSRLGWRWGRGRSGGGAETGEAEEEAEQDKEGEEEDEEEGEGEEGAEEDQGHSFWGAFLLGRRFSSRFTAEEEEEGDEEWVEGDGESDSSASASSVATPGAGSSRRETQESSEGAERDTAGTPQRPCTRSQAQGQGKEPGMKGGGLFGRKKKDKAAECEKDFLGHPLSHTVKIRTQSCQLDIRGEATKRQKREEEDGALKRVNPMKMLMAREAGQSRVGRFSSADRCNIALGCLPQDGPLVVDSMRSRAYIGQFSGDGTLFVAGFQDRRIRIYDVEKGWALRKDVFARNLRWTVTDTSLSPNHQFLVYASITPVVHLVNVGVGSQGVQSHANVTDIHEELNFCCSTSRDTSFGIWALQYSADGSEIVAGTSDQSLYIYDLSAGKSILRIKAHDDDVNAVAFADASSNLIFSGSDDNLCKVWDRRLMGPKRSKPVGVLVGHCEGVTHICAMGDGRYFISNGKDQTIKLWDIRAMLTPSDYASLPRAKVPSFRWDYRWMDYPGRGKKVKHPHDRAVMTYTGHHVLQTLIRCYFSPMHSTGQRYIYSGSHDGAVYIFDLLTGKLVKKLVYHQATVRDCCWHPYYPQLVSTAWDGRVAVWEHLKGEAPAASGLASRRMGVPCEDSHDMFEW